jgi:hypothetical protein
MCVSLVIFFEKKKKKRKTQHALVKNEKKIIKHLLGRLFSFLHDRMPSRRLDRQLLQSKHTVGHQFEYF